MGHMTKEQAEEYINLAHADFKLKLCGDLGLNPETQHPNVKAAFVHIETSRLLLQKWLKTTETIA